MPTLEYHLTHFQPFEKSSVESPRAHSSGDPVYREVGENVHAIDWDDFTIENLKKLSNLAPSLSMDIAMTLPERFSSDLCFFFEAYVDSFVANTLFYTVKTVLGQCFNNLPISILSQIPFSSITLKKMDPSTALQRYTSDYSVFRGILKKSLIGNENAALVVGDVKLVGDSTPPDKDLLQKEKSTAQKHHMGQLLWYCSRRKTRFAMHISERHLVVAQCTYKSSMSDQEGAKLEEKMKLSVDVEGLLDPVTPKMKPTSSDSGSESSDTDLPKNKKTLSEIASATVSRSPPFLLGSSPPSKQVDENSRSSPISVETPRNEDNSSPELPSSQITDNGGMTVGKVKGLSKKDGGFQVRLFTLDLREPEAKDAPLVVLGLIALAALVDDDKYAKLRMSRKPIMVTSYF
ncbi:hypothetical protein BOTCAL_0404g00150 [Botryotinia calthae]|uniref:Uncharacterized protein n=1 Tax=Botryotinia calthae TaxID=38488 RepID=A0A4Y8CQ09_9HELO|nr:hypothetical protein BOTCAL_0404g00150 [Botryotinia calthae]